MRGRGRSSIYTYIAADSGKVVHFREQASKLAEIVFEDYSFEKNTDVIHTPIRYVGT